MMSSSSSDRRLAAAISYFDAQFSICLVWALFTSIVWDNLPLTTPTPIKMPPREMTAAMSENIKAVSIMIRSAKIISEKGSRRAGKEPSHFF
jgi:hypothetical protein